MANHVAADVFGTMGTVCWTGQIVPQIWKSWREKSTEGFSHWLMLIWGVASVFLGAYAFIQRFNIPLTLQPQLFGFLCLISWGQCQYYHMKRTRRTAILMTGGVMMACGLVELLLVLTIRPIQNPHSKKIASSFFGVVAAVLISVALLPQYYEIYKLKAVIGISLVFITIDMLGGLFNDISLAFGENFDVIAAVSYTLVIVLDGVILICAALFKFLAWRRSKANVNDRGEAHVADNDVVDKEAAGTAPLQHPAILSRSGSRCSDTPSRCSMIVMETVRGTSYLGGDGSRLEDPEEGGMRVLQNTHIQPTDNIQTEPGPAPSNTAQP